MAINQSGNDARGDLENAIHAAETFVMAITNLMRPFETLSSLAGDDSTNLEGSTAQLEALIRRILLGEEGSGGLLAELLAGALSAGEDGEPSPLLKALQAALLTSLLGGENGEQSPLLGISRCCSAAVKTVRPVRSSGRCRRASSWKWSNCPL